MKIVRNRFIPFKGFAAINLFGLLFVREDTYITDRLLCHERIHSAQMKEMLYIGFYVWYLVEWLIRLVTNPREAYRSISFEREAYANEHQAQYLINRKPFAWFRYINNKKTI